MRSIPVVLGLLIWTVSAVAQTFPAPFSDYSFATIYQNRYNPVIQVSFGGLAVVRTDVNRLPSVGNAAGSGAAVYSVPVTRDASNSIVAVSGPAVFETAAAKASQSLVYGPPHLHGALAYSIESGSGGVDFGLVKSGGTTVFSVVPESSNAVQFVPGFVGGSGLGAGELKILAYNGRFYSSFYYSDHYQPGAGPFALGPANLITTLPYPSGAFVYVKAGSTGFPNNAMLVAEPADNRIVAYDVNGNGNPLVHTRRIFFSGLSLISGMTVDPISFDLLISTRANSSSGIYRIHGLRGETSTVLSQCDSNLTKSGVYSLANDLSSSQGCLIFRDNVNITLDCNGKSIAGGVNLHAVTGFTLRNCTLKPLGGALAGLSLINSSNGSVVDNVIGGPANPYAMEVLLFNVLGTTMQNNQMAIRWLAAEFSQNFVLRQNQITAIPGSSSSYLVYSKQGIGNTFDANTLTGNGTNQYAFAMLNENSSSITNNAITNFTIGLLTQLGTNINLTIAGNTVF